MRLLKMLSQLRAKTKRINEYENSVDSTSGTETSSSTVDRIIFSTIFLLLVVLVRYRCLLDTGTCIHTVDRQTDSFLLLKYQTGTLDHWDLRKSSNYTTEIPKIP
jgi:preprotein translocase subunit SecD